MAGEAYNPLVVCYLLRLIEEALCSKDVIERDGFKWCNNDKYFPWLDCLRHFHHTYIRLSVMVHVRPHIKEDICSCFPNGEQSFHSRHPFWERVSDHTETHAQVSGFIV